VIDVGSLEVGFQQTWGKFDSALPEFAKINDDSVDCPQQRCLIHLMRDLNDDIHQEPFNLEIKEIVQEFGALLAPIIDTIDRFGLKTHFLKMLLGVFHPARRGL